SPPVPNHHCAAAILPLRNNAFEVLVFDRMIFHFHGEMFFASLPRKSFWQRPRFKHAFHLQTEIVVQTARSVFLNDETRRAFDFFGSRFPCRLSCLLKVAFAFVFGQSHSVKVTADHLAAREVLVAPATADFDLTSATTR